MARKKSCTPDGPQPPSMTDAAGMLATYAAAVLARPESRSHAASLKLSHSERALLVGMPGLDVRLKERLDILSTATRAIPFTLDELARICLAVSEALLDVEGRDAVRMLGVAGKVTDLLSQAVGELEGTEKPRRAAPQGREDHAEVESGGQGLPAEDHTQGHQAAGLATSPRPRLLAGQAP